MHFKQKKGFTLIELLVVVGIIVIIASLVIVSVAQARTNGRDAKRVADLKSIQNALEMYYEQNKEYPAPTAGVYTYTSNDSSNNWTTAFSNALSSFINPLPKDPMNGKTGIKVVNTNACVTAPYSSALSYIYKTNTDKDSYKIVSKLEVRCEGVDANDGGIYNPYYEIWGGKTGQAITIP